MARKIVLDAESKLTVKELSGNRFVFEMLVFISEDINYMANDIIDSEEYESGYIEGCIFDHCFIDEPTPMDIALAIFKQKAEEGLYAV